MMVLEERPWSYNREFILWVTWVSITHFLKMWPFIFWGTLSGLKCWSRGHFDLMVLLNESRSGSGGYSSWQYHGNLASSCKCEFTNWRPQPSFRFSFTLLFHLFLCSPFSLPSIFSSVSVPSPFILWSPLVSANLSSTSSLSFCLSCLLLVNCLLILSSILPSHPLIIPLFSSLLHAPTYSLSIYPSFHLCSCFSVFIFIDTYSLFCLSFSPFSLTYISLHVSSFYLSLAPLAFPSIFYFFSFFLFLLFFHLFSSSIVFFTLLLSPSRCLYLCPCSVYLSSGVICPL